MLGEVRYIFLKNIRHKAVSNIPGAARATVTTFFADAKYFALAVIGGDITGRWGEIILVTSLDTPGF